MLHGIVIGTATTTIRHPSLKGLKLLIVQPVGADGRTPDGDPQLAVDACGAGRGAPVIIASDGKYCRAALGSDVTPVRWSVIAIDDQQPGRAGR